MSLTPIDATEIPGVLTIEGPDGEAAHVSGAADRVLDMETFYIASRQIDQLRDTTQFLMHRKVRVADASLAKLRSSYKDLRDMALNAVTPPVRVSEGDLAHEVDDSATLVDLVLAAGLFANWLDSQLSVDAFVIGQRVQRFNAGKLAEQVATQEAAAAQDTPTPTPAPATGSYL